MSIKVIAEAGSNHNGNLDQAISLIDIAKRSNADSIKFQFIFADGLYIPKIINYATKGYSNNGAYEVRKDEELSENDWMKIWQYAKEVKLDISASVFCERGIDLLKKLGANYVKIASTDLTNHNLIKKVCQYFPKIIISTGMSTFSEITDMLEESNVFSSSDTIIELMHCVSIYPCNIVDANIYRIKNLFDTYKLNVGYSDHTQDNNSALMALALGVTTFEKHFTLDKSLPGFDHKYALNETELTSYINTLKSGFQALKKTDCMSISKGEEITKIRARRGVYASKNIKSGSILTKEDLLYVRPSTMQADLRIEHLLGKVVAEDISQYSPLKLKNNVAFQENDSSNSLLAINYWENEMIEKGLIK